MPQHPQVMTAERAANYWRIDVVPHGPTSPPVVVNVPYASLTVEGAAAPGNTVSITMGIWDYEPTSYAAGNGSVMELILQALWARQFHMIASADLGTELTCVVTATNAIGSTTAPPSNAVIIP